MIRFLFPLLLAFISHANAADCLYAESPPDAERVPGEGSIASAWYGGPATRYPHAVLGDGIEAETLYVLPRGSVDCALSVTLDEQSVFEDLSPRIADVTGDGNDDIITIESHADYGASLAIYSIRDDKLVKISSTPYIGTRFRWLAPVGVADFNADRIPDVAYVETPHLAGVLKIWSFADAQPVLLASQAGFSNHRIGENFISGGIAECADGPVIVVPDRSWRHTEVVRLTGNTLSSKTVATDATQATLSRHLQCEHE